MLQICELLLRRSKTRRNLQRGADMPPGNRAAAPSCKIDATARLQLNRCGRSVAVPDRLEKRSARSVAATQGDYA